MKESIDNLKHWWALLGICLLAFTLFLDVGIVANALPAIQKTFHANNTQVQWLISAFMLALCIFMVVDFVAVTKLSPRFFHIMEQKLFPAAADLNF